MQAIVSKLQKISSPRCPDPALVQRRVVAGSNVQWTGWPSDGGSHVVPITWNGYWQMGAVNMFSDIKPAGQ